MALSDFNFYALMTPLGLIAPFSLPLLQCVKAGEPRATFEPVNARATIFYPSTGFRR
jgi:hypothetical protein